MERNGYEINLRDSIEEEACIPCFFPESANLFLHNSNPKKGTEK